MKYKFILFALSMLFALNSFADDQYTKENLNRIIPVSPNAASLGIFGSIPVGHFTGVPQISIPIHEIDFHGLKIPIELNYHASGIKVAQEASSVGLGWALNAGGCISRQILHLDDFLYYQGHYTSARAKPAYPEGDNPVFDTRDYLPFMGLQGKFDAEPDYFTYSFSNHAGAFYLQPRSVSNGLASIMGKENALQIYYTEATNSWEVTDAYGFKYIFGASSDTRETARTFSRIGIHTVDINTILRADFTSKDVSPSVTAWYLKSITSPQNDCITFNYKKEKLLSKYQLSEEKYFRVDYSYPNLENLSDEYDFSSMSYAENEQLLLSSIEYDGGSIEFGYETRTDLQLSHVSNISNKLTSVSVYENITSTAYSRKKRVKHCTLAHSYMGHLADHQYSRLMLDEVCFLPTDNSTTDVQKYNFTYNPGSLPSKYSQAVDYWGYYNGRGSLIRGSRRDSGISPFIYSTSRWHWETLSFGGMNRSPEERYAQYGMLRSIQYPTGGKTIFEFELNDFTDKIKVGTTTGNTDLSRGGGLRIKRVIDLANDLDTASIRRFVYKQNNVSSGRLKVIPVHHREVRVYDSFAGTLAPYLTRPVTYINIHSEGFSSSILNSGNIGYSYVEEHNVTDGRNNGYTTYRFKNYTGGGNTSVFGVPVLISSSDGKPEQITWYNGEGNPVKKQTFYYQSVNRGRITGMKCYIPPMYAPFFYLNNQIGSDFKVAYYSMSSDCVLESTVTEEEFFANGTLKKTIVYGYHGASNLRNYQKTTMNGDVYETQIKYPSDFTDYISANMQQRHMIGVPIETINKCNGKITDAQKTVYSTYSSYDDYSILPAAIYRFRNENSLGLTAYQNHYEKEVQIDAYDSFGNVQQYTDRDNLKVVYVWSRGKYPIAVIKNASAEEVDLALAELGHALDDFSESYPDVNDLTDLQAYLPDAHVTLFTHLPERGISSLCDPSGKTTYYDYDGLGRLRNIRNDSNQMIESYDYNYSTR